MEDKPGQGGGLSMEEGVKLGGRQGAHVMIWAPLDDKLGFLGKYPGRAAVLMQMRFDGSLGFPGGLVDDKIEHLPPSEAMEGVVAALNRELEEEVNADLDLIQVKADDYLFSMGYGNPDKRVVCHFFTYQTTLEHFKTLEKAALDAEDYGGEVLGHLRVPLFTMHDGDRGFPRFLRNVFAGCAKEQLLRGLVANGIFTKEEIQSIDKSFEA